MKLNKFKDRVSNTSKHIKDMVKRHMDNLDKEHSEDEESKDFKGCQVVELTPLKP